MGLIVFSALPVKYSSAESLQGDRWLSLPPMPTPRAGAAVAVLGKQILVVGGVGEDQSPLKVVEMYNTEEGRWRKRSSLREALMGVSITVKGTDYITISRNKRCTAEKQNEPWFMHCVLIAHLLVMLCV